MPTNLTPEQTAAAITEGVRLAFMEALRSTHHRNTTSEQLLAAIQGGVDKAIWTTWRHSFKSCPLTM